MQGGFIYRDEHGIFQQHNGGGMFGLATEEFIRVHVGAKIDVLTKRIDEALIEMARARVNPVETVKVVPAEPVKLYTVEVTKDGARIGTYHDVTHVYDERGGYSEQLNIYRTSGQVVLKGKDYSYSLTEQKAEPEVKSIGLYGIGAFQELRKYADELNHRIELLELRLNGAEKQAKPTKGAKR